MLLFVHSFLNGIALVFFETTANTLFLMEYNTSSLPYVYMLTAVVSVVAGYYYSKLEDSVTIAKLLQLTMLFVIFIILFFLMLIKFSDSKLSYMGIMISKDLVWMFVGMEFGILTGMIFNIRQGKRLFGLLMSGEILAGILAGLSISVILNYISTVNLLFVSTTTLILSYILLQVILNKYSHRFEEDGSDDEIDDGSMSYSTLLKNKYYLLFFGVSVLSFLIFYFIDYIFYYSVEAKYTNEKELASFFGVFYAVLNAVNLFSSLLISGAMLSRFGIIFGIMAIPILALIGTSSLLATAALSLGFGFLLLITVKLLNEVLDISILNPTFKVVYQSIPIKQRMKVLAFRETIVEPSAMGLAGLLLLGASMMEGIEAVYYIIIVMSVAWIVLGKMLKDQYVVSLEKLLNQREVFDDDLLLDDLDINIFLNGLKSDNDIEVIYCLDSLTKLEYDDLDNKLVELLSHKSSKVRISVLEYIEKLNKYNLVQNLYERIDEENNYEVLSKLLKLYTKLGTVDAIDKASEFVKHENSLIQEGAILGLLQYCGIDGVLIAGKVLNKLFESNNKEDKLSALNIVKHMSVPSFYKPLKESIGSNDKEIKLIAIEAIGNVGIRKLLPELFSSLELDEYRNTTMQSLIKFGVSIYGELIEYFNLTSNYTVKNSLIKIISTMKTDSSYQFLFDNIKTALLSDAIIARLFDINFTTKDDDLIEELLTNEVKEILFYLSILKMLDRDIFSNSHIVLQEIRDKKINNLFLILGFKYPKEMILQAKLNYNSKSKDTKAYAIEVIDNMLSQNIKKIVLPIFEDVSIQKKLNIYKNTSYEVIENQESFIEKVLADTNIFLVLKLSIIYELGKNKITSYIKHLEQLTTSSNTDIKHTTMWALKQIKG